jgi:transcriptional regulator with XRE-family HTH domain
MRKTDVQAHFGTLEAIAKAIGVSKSAVGQWPERVPQGSAYKLQFVTGGILRVDPAMYPRITKKKLVKPPGKQSIRNSTVAAA